MELMMILYEATPTYRAPRVILHYLIVAAIPPGAAAPHGEYHAAAAFMMPRFRSMLDECLPYFHMRPIGRIMRFRMMLAHQADDIEDYSMALLGL